MIGEFPGCVRIEPNEESRFYWAHHRVVEGLPRIGTSSQPVTYESYKEALDQARHYLRQFFVTEDTQKFQGGVE